MKENIEIAIQAARSRGEALDHVLLYGPPGLGKTTLAQIIASELGVTIKTSSGPLLERKGDLTAILTSLEQREVFFLDEIHRLVPAIEEVLYPAMEDYRIDLVIGQGAGARIHPFILNRFTLIGATTRAGLVTAPLRSRFGIVHRLDFYTPEDLVIIVRRSASILGIAVDDDGAFFEMVSSPQPWHAARRQPAAAPRARFRASPGAGTHHPRGGQGIAADAGRG